MFGTRFASRSLIIAWQNVVKSMRNSVRFFSSCVFRHRGLTGIKSDPQAFKLQASEAITMYAQLLVRLSSGAVNAWTPFFCCSIRFSWQ